jgi:hypothetical protein
MQALFVQRLAIVAGKRRPDARPALTVVPEWQRRAGLQARRAAAISAA